MVEPVVYDSPYWQPTEVRRAELLAWYAKVDDRPLYVNVALFWLELSPINSKGRWALIQLGQNPIPHDSDSPENRPWRTSWRPYIINDAKWEPFAIFDHAPTAGDIREFMREWDDSSSRWKYLSAGVRAETWERLIGEKPPTEVLRGEGG